MSCERFDQARVQVFSTCPPLGGSNGTTYRQQVVDAARWSEAAGCEGILVYTDNGLLDPWLVSQVVIESTGALRPLVAVQPAYMHPYSVAKMVASLGHLHGRKVYLNMVAGGFKNDLAALGDQTPHDERYVRLVEYTRIIQMLLSESAVASLEGRYYRIQALKMLPPLPGRLAPGVFISGSSGVGLSAVRELKATAVQYPRPPSEYEGPLPEDGQYGVRVGVLARATSEAAWEIGYQRFPPDRKGQLTHQLSMKVSDSVWHRQLSELGQTAQQRRNPYWLTPFENYKTFCPYLVGSYEEVAEELARYIRLRYTVFILDVPVTEDDLHHAAQAFALACELAGLKEAPFRAEASPSMAR